MLVHTIGAVYSAAISSSRSLPKTTSQLPGMRTSYPRAFIAGIAACPRESCTHPLPWKQSPLSTMTVCGFSSRICSKRVFIRATPPARRYTGCPSSR